MDSRHESISRPSLRAMKTPCKGHYTYGDTYIRIHGWFRDVIRGRKCKFDGATAGVEPVVKFFRGSAGMADDTASHFVTLLSDCNCYRRRRRRSCRRCSGVTRLLSLVSFYAQLGGFMSRIMIFCIRFLFEELGVIRFPLSLFFLVR